MRRSPLVRSLLASAALVAAIALAGCNTDGTLPTNAKAMAPLSPRMVSDIESKNMDKESPILVRVFKQESELEIWKQDRSGRFALLKTYPICRWSGELGPKVREGDRQAPEGFYTITPGQMNPNSQFYLAFDLGYPNAYDRSHGRTGAHLMVHGDCSSRGCYSMTDEQISEIYALGREAFFGGQRAFQVQAYPFRMTPENFAKHRNSPHIAFWKMLKRGNDHFETTKLEPKVNVCEKRYVFDAYDRNDPTRSPSFSASSKCPAYSVPEDVVALVQEKSRADEIRIAQLSPRTPVAPVRTGADGGMHPVFVAAVKRNEVGVSPAAYSVASLPGTIPPTVRPPRIPELEGSPLVTGNPITPPPAANHSISSEPPMRAATPAAEPVLVASAEPTTTASALTTASTSTGNFFSGLFSSKSSDSKSEGGTMDRMAKLIGLRGSDAPAKPAAAPPAPKPRPAATRPAAKPAQAAAPGAIRPAPAQPAPAVQTAERPAATPAAATTGGAIAGAAPVVPAGSFDNRWSAFR